MPDLVNNLLNESPADRVTRLGKAALNDSHFDPNITREQITARKKRRKRRRGQILGHWLRDAEEDQRTRGGASEDRANKSNDRYFRRDRAKNRVGPLTESEAQEFPRLHPKPHPRDPFRDLLDEDRDTVADLVDKDVSDFFSSRRGKKRKKSSRADQLAAGARESAGVPQRGETLHTIRENARLKVLTAGKTGKKASQMLSAVQAAASQAPATEQLSTLADRGTAKGGRRANPAASATPAAQSSTQEAPAQDTGFNDLTSNASASPANAGDPTAELRAENERLQAANDNSMRFAMEQLTENLRNRFPGSDTPAPTPSARAHPHSDNPAPRKEPGTGNTVSIQQRRQGISVPSSGQPTGAGTKGGAKPRRRSHQEHKAAHRNREGTKRRIRSGEGSRSNRTPNARFGFGRPNRPTRRVKAGEQRTETDAKTGKTKTKTATKGTQSTPALTIEEFLKLMAEALQAGTAATKPK